LNLNAIAVPLRKKGDPSDVAIQKNEEANSRLRRGVGSICQTLCRRTMATSSLLSSLRSAAIMLPQVPYPSKQENRGGKVIGMRGLHG
jgi:hypothetical protein